MIYVYLHARPCGVAQINISITTLNLQDGEEKQEVLFDFSIQRKYVRAESESGSCLWDDKIISCYGKCTWNVSGHLSDFLCIYRWLHRSCQITTVVLLWRFRNSVPLFVVQLFSVLFLLFWESAKKTNLNKNFWLSTRVSFPENGYKLQLK